MDFEISPPSLLIADLLRIVARYTGNIKSMLSVNKHWHTALRSVVTAISNRHAFRSEGLPWELFPAAVTFVVFLEHDNGEDDSMQVYINMFAAHTRRHGTVCIQNNELSCYPSWVRHINMQGGAFYIHSQIQCNYIGDRATLGVPMPRQCASYIAPGMTGILNVISGDIPRRLIIPFARVAPDKLSLVMKECDHVDMNWEDMCLSLNSAQNLSVTCARLDIIITQSSWRTIRMLVAYLASSWLDVKGARVPAIHIFQGPYNIMSEFRDVVECWRELSTMQHVPPLMIFVYCNNLGSESETVMCDKPELVVHLRHSPKSPSATYAPI